MKIFVLVLTFYFSFQSLAQLPVDPPSTQDKVNKSETEKVTKSEQKSVPVHKPVVTFEVRTICNHLKEHAQNYQKTDEALCRVKLPEIFAPMPAKNIESVFECVVSKDKISRQEFLQCVTPEFDVDPKIVTYAMAAQTCMYIRSHSELYKDQSCIAQLNKIPKLFDQREVFEHFDKCIRTLQTLDQTKLKLCASEQESTPKPTKAQEAQPKPKVPPLNK